MGGRRGVRHTAQRAADVLRAGTLLVTPPARGPPGAPAPGVRSRSEPSRRAG
ncbi:hypothetical protein SBD_3282 [Streptomyces bottropensis ATCC 25435]|uniref:Uncharacterized protein n=1 Tax=Streptomyces bottropensis ATCC 25435 TaxID=1054862 RepID=M3F344_9ACTN|nr:hypothetical protein SBD_3282 [Streptomyces bottropensis ATCC 25435]